MNNRGSISREGSKFLLNKSRRRQKNGGLEQGYVCVQGREGCHTGRLLVRKWVHAGLRVGCVDFWENGWI